VLASNKSLRDAYNLASNNHLEKEISAEKLGRGGYFQEEQLALHSSGVEKAYADKKKKEFKCHIWV
jgi:hypothetical protein